MVDSSCGYVMPEVRFEDVRKQVTCVDVAGGASTESECCGWSAVKSEAPAITNPFIGVNNLRRAPCEASGRARPCGGYRMPRQLPGSRSN